MYRVSKKDGGVTEVTIYSERSSNGRGISMNFFVKKIDGKYKWSGN